ncbi:hypothetical protein GH741_05250 [Aquibacillus halophilus]|uniref:Lipoprotein n=1 Tax=Aquibacillus halophilus TaxID=930132 RepID=A0A6A8D9X3_9BACI|nr:hypothetical protein [Aquibacillus halophilus]MRH42080.1 hypothetical protein [Aquibacillus halophilus]
MKKFIIFSFLVILLVSCSRSEKDNYALVHSELLPDENDHYSLEAVGKEITFEILQEKDITNVSPITNSDSYEFLNKQYPQLDIKEKPAFILFDVNGLALKTYDYNELINFLQDNQIE